MLKNAKGDDKNGRKTKINERRISIQRKNHHNGRELGTSNGYMHLGKKTDDAF